MVLSNEIFVLIFLVILFLILLIVVVIVAKLFLNVVGSAFDIIVLYSCSSIYTYY